MITLTTAIVACETPGVYIGCLVEMAGCTTQGASEDEVFNDLVEAAGVLLKYRMPGVSVEEIQVVRGKTYDNFGDMVRATRNPRW